MCLLELDLCLCDRVNQVQERSSGGGEAPAEEIVFVSHTHWGKKRRWGVLISYAMLNT